MVRYLLPISILGACTSGWLPSMPGEKAASATEPETTAAMWNAFVDDVEAASVVRVYYAWPQGTYGGMTRAMVTVHEDGRAAIDHSGGLRMLIHEGELKPVSGDRFIELNGGPIDATGWPTAISVALNHLSSVPTTLWGPDLPAHQQGTFPDLGYAVQVRLDIGGDDSLNLGFLKEGELRAATFENDGEVAQGYWVKHVVFDPVLPADFFEPGGTVRADGSETLWRGPDGL